MNLTKLCFILFVILTAFSSCSDTEIMRKMDVADSYINDRPEEALDSLRAIPERGLRTRKAKARYALLYSIALDKNYIDTTDLSIISKAVEYYSGTEDNENKARSYYYYARVLKNGGEEDKAIEALNKAEIYAEDIEDYYLRGLIDGEKGSIYEGAWDFENAISSYKAAIRNYEVIGKQENIMYLTNNLSSVYIKELNYEKAIECTRQTRHVAEFLRDTAMVISAGLDIASIYYRTDGPEKALEELNDLAEKYNAGEYSAFFYPNLAQIYMALGNYEKARYYAEELLDENREDPAPGILALLYLVEKSAGNYKKSNEYIMEYLEIKDSLSQARYERSVYEANKRYQNQELKYIIETKDKQLRNRLVVYTLVVLIILALSGIVLLFRQKLILEKDKKIKEYQDRIDTVQKYCDNLEEMRLSEPAKKEVINRQLQMLKQSLEILVKSKDEISISLYSRLVSMSKSDEKEASVMLSLFISVFDLTYPGLRDDLRGRFSNLSEQDINLFALICLDCPTNVIAFILNTSDSYIYNKRMVLRKKLQITNDAQTFKNFIQKMTGGTMTAI